MHKGCIGFGMCVIIPRKSQNSGGATMAVTPDDGLLQAMTDTIVNAVAPEEVFLFGSAARGDAGAHSDLDFLIILPDTARASRRDAVRTLYTTLSGYPVAKDLLVYTRSDVERWRDVQGHVIEAGLREGRRLYAMP
jgi:predicted nucleotidyltransferase